MYQRSSSADKNQTTGRSTSQPLESGTDERVLILILRSEVQCGVKGREEQWSGGVEEWSGGAEEQKLDLESTSQRTCWRRNDGIGKDRLIYYCFFVPDVYAVVDDMIIL